MRLLPSLLISCALALPLAACGSSTDDDGAAHIGVVAEIAQMPDLTIDDQNGTDLRVFVELRHMGGPEAETLELVSAGLNLDAEHYADIELAIPADHPQFEGLADGEEFGFELRGSLPDTHTDWGLCVGPQTEDEDELRVSVDLVLRVTPGANDEADEFEFEALAVELHCSHTN